MRLLLLCICVLTCVVKIKAYDNDAPHSRLPPMGWSSWVALGPGAEHPQFDYCDEFSVKAAADAYIETGLYDHGYRHFHLDDCWAGGRNATGYLYPEMDHFPNGLQPVIDYVHSKGLTFGLYTCGGTHTCVGGRPGSKDHWKQDAAVWAEWGVDWVKMDWCNTQGMNIEDSYSAMSQALNSSGRHIHFNMCEWGLDAPWTWGDTVAQSWRMHGDHTGNWGSTKEVIAASAAIPRKNTGVAYGWNDMDMLETGCAEQCAHANNKPQNMSALEYKTEFSMWAISASPLLFTAPIMNCTNSSTGSAGEVNVVCKGWLSELQKEILFNTEVIAVNQDVTPQGTPIDPTDITVWSRELTGGDVAVALYNPADGSAELGPLDFNKDFGWAVGTTAHVRDLWAHKDLGVFTDTFPAQATLPHQTHMLRFSKA